MSDKKFFNKGKNKNRNNRSKNRSNKNKINHFVPTQEQRVDTELLQEVSVFLSLSPEIDDKVICRHYHITERQLQFIKKHQQKWDIWDSLTKNKEE